MLRADIMQNKPLDKSTFFYHFQQSTGGLYDPKLVKAFIKHLEEWLPDCPDFWDTNDSYAEGFEKGQEKYREFLLDKLIQKDYKNW
jgi:hypothetical protein